MNKTTNTDTLKEILKYKIEEGEKAKSKFFELASSNFLYATTWLEVTIELVAMQELCQRFLDSLNKGNDRETIIENMKEEVLSHARFLSRSTSVLSNVVEDNKKAVLAQLLDLIK